MLNHKNDLPMDAKQNNHLRMFINTLVWGAVCTGVMIGLLT